MSEDSRKTGYKEYIDRKVRENKEVWHVGLGAHMAGVMADAMAPLWYFLGKMEADFAEPKLEKIRIDKPVYVCGLARAGTTITLELLHRSGYFGSYTYMYYPFIAFPLIWHAVAKNFLNDETRPRVHFDRIDVHADSPEALEEMIWMHFFPGIVSDPSRAAVLDALTENPAFEAFYRNAIKKVLHITGKGRYLAKGNYNFLRIPYILKVNPDAKFIVLVREPEAHVASLTKQHYLFRKIGSTRVVSYMRRIGHYEFGPHRVPLNFGDKAGAEAIQAAWDAGDETAGWAMLWRDSYAFLHDRVLADPACAKAVKLVRYEEMCAEPEKTAREIAAFCGIPAEQALLDFAGGISAPAYYDSGFSAEDKARIAEITGAVRGKIYGG